MDMNEILLSYIQSTKKKMAAKQIGSDELITLAWCYLQLNRPTDAMILYNNAMMRGTHKWYGAHYKNEARSNLKALILKQNQLGKFSLSDTNSKKILENLINAELLSLQKNENLDEASNNANKFLSDFHALFTSEHEKKLVHL